MPLRVVGIVFIEPLRSSGANVSGPWLDPRSGASLLKQETPTLITSTYYGLCVDVCRCHGVAVTTSPGLLPQHHPLALSSGPVSHIFSLSLVAGKE